MHDREADLFDVFNTMRVHLMGGWDAPESYWRKLDQEIDEEFRSAG